MPFNQLPGGFRVKFRRTRNWVRNFINRVGQILRVKRILFEYLLPIQLWRDYKNELPRQQSYIIGFLNQKFGEEAKRHEPSRSDRFMYGVSVLSRRIWNFCLTLITIQFIFAVLNTIIPSTSQRLIIQSVISILKMSDYHPAITILLIIVDIIILSLLIVVALSNVALYGPTSACFVIAFKLKEPTGSYYRRALNSYPRAGDDNEVQLKRWMRTRLYAKLIARAEGREKLGNILIAVFTSVICISIISYLFTSPRVYMPLIQSNAEPVKISYSNTLNTLPSDELRIQCNPEPVKMQDGIWKHLHFFLVTFATIGFGDMTFINTTIGHIVGAIMSILVIGMVLGFVSYVNHYLSNFRERIFAGLDLEAESGASWIAQSLRDI
jgi:hypothetical protein